MQQQCKEPPPRPRAAAAGPQPCRRACLVRSSVVMLGLGLLLHICAQSPGSFHQSRFVIGGGPDPPPTNVSYSNLHAAGVTFVHADSDEVTSVAGAKQMAALCSANNLSCALPLVAVDTVAPDDGGSVWGYFLHDEPKAKDFAGLAKAVASVRSRHPDALSFINLLGTANFSAAEAKALYGVATYTEYVDSFIATVKPDILSYDCYPEYTSMDNFHYNAAFMRNKSLHAGIPLWNYIWLEANGRGHGAGFYRWQLFVSAAYGSRGIMQWSLSPCGRIRECGPKDRWAPFPCLLDKHGQLFKPVASMAVREHRRLVAMGPLLIRMDSLQVQRHKHSRTTPVIKVAGMPLQSISGGAWLLGHFRSPQHGECVMIVNDDPINTAFPSINLGDGGGGGRAAVVHEVDQESGSLVTVVDEAPDVAGFQLFWDEGGGRLFCWGNLTTARPFK
jgi:hypothetical protein